MPSLDAVVDRIKRQEGYRPLFDSAFGAQSSITIERVVEAIASYERTLITPDTPFDRFVRGDSTALTNQQVRGMQLFETFGCQSCHFGPNFNPCRRLGDRFPIS